MFYEGGSRGAEFADALYTANLLVDGLSIRDYYRLAKTDVTAYYDGFRFWIERDSFWEDFASRLEELDIELKD